MLIWFPVGGWQWVMKCKVCGRKQFWSILGHCPSEENHNSIRDNLPLCSKLNLKPPKYKWTYESYMFSFMGSNCLMFLHKIINVIKFLKDYFTSVLLSWTYSISVIALEPEISYIFIIDISLLSRSIATKLSWLLTSSFHKLRNHSCVTPFRSSVQVITLTFITSVDCAEFTYTLNHWFPKCVLHIPRDAWMHFCKGYVEVYLLFKLRDNGFFKTNCKTF
jgi:hypothetical protein